MNIILILVLLILLKAPAPAATAEEAREVKNVLIINSYHQGFVWTRQEIDGILERFSESGNNVSIMVEYLDWKNYNSKDNLEYLSPYFKYKYENKSIDIIITTDDIALKFALENRKEIFNDAPIVFCGVNQTGYDSIAEGYEGVTGVIEVIDPTEMIEIALTINPSLKNIYLLYDNSESGLSTGEIITEAINNMNLNLNIIPWNNMVYSDIINQVQTLQNDSIVLLTTYYSDINSILDFDFVMGDISRNSSVPVYNIYDFGLNRGTLGGSMLSGRLQGEGAAELALQIINGDDISSIPLVYPQSNSIVFDYEQLKRFDISLDLLPEKYELINKPFSFYETYKKLVIGVILAFTVLIMFLCVLLFYIRKIKKMRGNLTESNDELKKTYDKLTYLAYYDMLTGVLNKQSLYETAKYVLTENRGKSSLLFIDIDNFKYVNDTLGHAFGDQLIVKVGERIRSMLDKGYSLYRLGGDEFVLLIEDISGIEIVESFALNILDDFKKGFEIDNSIFYISISIGIVMYPEHGDSLDQLLKYADIAMYQAKEQGKKNYVVFNELMNTAFKERVEIEKYIHRAMEKNEFDVYYQPQIDTKNKRITGMEALLRWNSLELGEVTPQKFIKVAEDTHYIIPLGTWALRKACAFLKELRMNGYDDLTVSVNISILQLLQYDFCDLVADTLEEYKVPPQLLELEITETILIESFETINPTIKKIHDMKVRIALDDFGKGYSSLNYLEQLPIDTLKVDKSFIDQITDKERITLTGYIIMLGKDMGMSVVAEGVEQKEQVDYLLSYNCDKIQGFLYSQALAEKEMLELLAENRRYQAL